jgi:ribose/xylose/arabinose/galactoside ABC-type transport system permease subunit
MMLSGTSFRLHQRRSLLPRLLARLLLLGVVVLVFAVTTSGFLNTRNLFALGQNFALLGLVTLALSMPMLVGEFDLSVEPLVAVSGLIAVKVGTGSAALGVGVAVALGTAIGLINGLLVVVLRLSSLVITLGAMLLLNGIAFWLAGGRVITYTNFEVGEALDRRILTVLSVRSLVTVAAFVFAMLVLRCTLVGRDVYASGSDRAAARNAGARTDLAVVFAFGWSSTLTALAGALLSMSLATASATLGAGLLLTAVSAAIIGGVALSGGIGTPLGVATGVLILAVLNNGLSLAGASSAVILLVNGLVLMAVVVAQGTPLVATREAVRSVMRRRDTRSGTTFLVGEGPSPTLETGVPAEATSGYTRHNEGENQ